MKNRSMRSQSVSAIVRQPLLTLFLAAPCATGMCAEAAQDLAPPEFAMTHSITLLQSGQGNWANLLQSGVMAQLSATQTGSGHTLMAS